MPEAPTPRTGGGGLGAVTRKLGPLPVWAWAGLVVLAFLAYRHLHGAPQAGAAQPSGGTTDQAYVPGFDAASGAGGGGIGSTPGDPTSFDYGAQGAAQADGGGTSTGTFTPDGGGGSASGTTGIHSFGPGGTQNYDPATAPQRTSTTTALAPTPIVYKGISAQTAFKAA